MNTRLQALTVSFVLLTSWQLPMTIYATANVPMMQQQPQPQPLQNPTPSPILATYLQMDSYSSGNYNRYYIQAPVNIDLTRFAGSQVYTITSDDQAWVSIFKNSGEFGINGKLYNKIQNQTHITTEILDLYGRSTFNRMDQDMRTGITRYDLEPGWFSVGDIDLSQVQYIIETYENGTGVLNVY